MKNYIRFWDFTPAILINQSKLLKRNKVKILIYHHTSGNNDVICQWNTLSGRIYWSAKHGIRHYQCPGSIDGLVAYILNILTFYKMCLHSAITIILLLRHIYHWFDRRVFLRTCSCDYDEHVWPDMPRRRFDRHSVLCYHLLSSVWLP